MADKTVVSEQLEARLKEKQGLLENAVEEASYTKEDLFALEVEYKKKKAKIIADANIANALNSPHKVAACINRLNKVETVI